MFHRLKSPVALLKQLRRPREQRAEARAARKQAKLDAAVHGRSAQVEAEARRYSNYSGGPY